MSKWGDFRISFVLTPWTWELLRWRCDGAWGFYFGPVEVCWTSGAVAVFSSVDNIKYIREEYAANPSMSGTGSDPSAEKERS